MLADVEPSFAVAGTAGKPLCCQTKTIKDPLKSVENKIVANGLPTAEPVKARAMTDTVTNGDAVDKSEVSAIENIGLTIRTEPFSDQYTVHSEIGRGQFAVVKRCRRRNPASSSDTSEFAAKFVRKRRRGRDCRADIEREVCMLNVALPHPRLVDVVEVFETANELVIVTEFAAGGELFKHVVLEEAFCERDVIRMMRQILEGLSFLHERNIVHLDVKPQNILLTAAPPFGDIKLCDFGFARHVHSGEDILDIVGTPDYVAPEVLSYEPIRTACDMWSVGVLTYVMLTGCSPFGGETKQETFLNISQVNLEFPDDLFADVSSHAIDFMRRLLVREPKKRMSVQDSLAHRWFTSSKTPTDAKPATADLKSDLISPSDLMPTLTVTTPIGSPIGCRRSLVAVPGNSAEAEPSKKCRCDNDNVPDSAATCTLPAQLQTCCTEEETNTATHVALSDPQLAY